MRRILALALAAVFGVSACQDSSSPAGPEADLPTAEATAAASQTVDVIVTLDADFAPGAHEANRRAAAAVARSLGLNPARTYGTALSGFAASVPSGRLNALARDPRIAAVELDQVAMIIPRPGVSNTAWIIDSGVDLDHPDPIVDVARSADFNGSRNGAEAEIGTVPMSPGRWPPSITTSASSVSLPAHR
ncbi:MAG: hypothetical protein P8188_10990 [Gemmatimonadota bacterium]